MKRISLWLVVASLLTVQAAQAVKSVERAAEVNEAINESRVVVFHIYHKGKMQEKDKAWHAAYKERNDLFEGLERAWPGVRFAKVNWERPHLAPIADQFNVTNKDASTFIIFVKEEKFSEPKEAARYEQSNPLDNSQLISRVQSLMMKKAKKQLDAIREELKRAREQRRAYAQWVYLSHPWSYYSPYGYGHGGWYGGYWGPWYEPWPSYGYYPGHYSGIGFHIGGRRRYDFGGHRRKHGRRHHRRHRGGGRRGGRRGGGRRGGGRRR